MKQSFKATICSMACALTSLAVFVSCGNNDDAIDPNDVESVNVKYSLNLSQTWFDFYDIKVTYFDESGQQQSMFVNEEWGYGFSVRPQIAPRNYVFTVVAIPKEVHPEFDREQYVLSQDIQGNFWGVRYDGSIYRELWSDLHPYELSNNDILTLNASGFKDYFEKGSRNLMNFTKSFDGKY